MTFNPENVRAMVRPIVTVGLVGSTIGAAFTDLAVAEFLMVPTGMTLAFWFASRQADRPTGG